MIGRQLMRSNLLIAAFCGALLVLSANCSSVTSSSNSGESGPASPDPKGTPMQEHPERKTAPPIDKRLASANTEFGLKLYRELLKQSGGKNLFVSPSSVEIALAMTYNGAAAETRDAMAGALGLEGMTLEEVNQAHRDAGVALESFDPKVELNIANSLWARKGVKFKADFVGRNKTYYNAEVSELDFSDPAATGTINGWVNDKTKGKIDRIIDEISPDSVLFLINAIYFKGKWTEEFDKAKTRDDTFNLVDGTQLKHPMMYQSGTYDYYKGTNFQAASLPYGEGRISMYIFLPDNQTTLAQFHENLTPDNWKKWMEEFDEMKGEITLPRFKTEYETDLNDALKALGMSVAFDPYRANFSEMLESARNAFINKVRHKTFVEVNEEGTEAAAVTSVDVQVTSVREPRETFRMVVDRPFFCAIRDNESGLILFMGSIMNPK